MERATRDPRNGLEGVVVAETRLSRVDGERGRLWICGEDVEVLARRLGFEELAALLFGEPPEPGAPAFRRALGRCRQTAFARLEGLGGALAAAEPMDALRAAMAALPSPPEDDGGAHRAEILAAAAVFPAVWWRKHQGLPAVAPDPDRGHAADWLRMCGIEDRDGARARALDTYWVTVAEHGMNASSFAARVVASTQSDPVSAVVAAIGALKGPLHGGAPGPVLDMLDAIGSPDAAEAWLLEELAAGRRIMGLGHRVYRVRDPRAAVLVAAVRALESAGVESRYLELAAAVEMAAVSVLARRHPERRLEANVEFYTAVLLDAVGLPRALFTSTFAAARTAGWLAHADEQRRGGRIIRPSQRYVGPEPAAACP